MVHPSPTLDAIFQTQRWLITSPSEFAYSGLYLPQWFGLKAYCISPDHDRCGPLTSFSRSQSSTAAVG